MTLDLLTTDRLAQAAIRRASSLLALALGRWEAHERAVRAAAWCPTCLREHDGRDDPAAVGGV